MEIISSYAKEIVSLLVPFITWLLNRKKNKAQLVRSDIHSFKFLVQEPRYDDKGNLISQTQTVHTASVLIRNIGKETATKVELVFNWKPILNMWNARHFEEKTLPDNRYAMIFDSLAPNEFLGFELLAVNFELPHLITVRSDQCVAKYQKMIPQPEVQPWEIYFYRFLIFIGLGTLVYFLIVLLQYLVLKTPITLAS